MCWKSYKIILINSIVVAVFATSCSSDEFPLTPIIIDAAKYNHNYTYSVNESTEYIFMYNKNHVNDSEGIRVIVESNNATINDPLSVIVKQKKEILSWLIPLEVEDRHSHRLFFSRTSRTLCPSEYYKLIRFDEGNQYVTVIISTSNPKNVSFNLILSPVPKIFMKSGEEKNLTITPSEPVYYGYKFNDPEDIPSVLITIESTSDVCMTFLIQNLSCPVFDLERNIKFAGYRQTVTRQGAITVPKRRYPNGFFVVLIVNVDDSKCTDKNNTVINRKKNIELKIINNITDRDYYIATLSILSVIIAFCLFYILGTIGCKIYQTRSLRGQIIRDRVQNAQQNINPVDNQIPDNQEADDRINNIPDQVNNVYDEVNNHLLGDIIHNEEVIHQDKKTRHYVVYLITVAIFYTTPAIQLVLMHQSLLHIIGNQDFCYYNFLCSHTFLAITDFNHVFSNLSYISLGLLFIFIVYMREKYDAIYQTNFEYGLRKHYGIDYAKGFALAMQGILSGTYHLCPNRNNFQFDTSFMYVTAVLCMVKIFQNRHADINAQAPVTFGVLAVAIFLVFVSVFDGHLYFWIIFNLIHMVTCLILSVQIYYMGNWNFRNFPRFSYRIIMTFINDPRSGIRYLTQPMYWKRLLVLTLFNFWNLGLAIFASSHFEMDFATYLLLILVTNLCFYTFLYIIMKLFHRETSRPYVWIYVILSFITWAGALYFFLNKTISWDLKPAESHTYNQHCVLLNFFDYHDIWHFLSALATFFSFMTLLTMDDDLVDVPYNDIPVF